MNHEPFLCIFVTYGTVIMAFIILSLIQLITALFVGIHHPIIQATNE